MHAPALLAGAMALLLAVATVGDARGGRGGGGGGGMRAGGGGGRMSGGRPSTMPSRPSGGMTGRPSTMPSRPSGGTAARPGQPGTRPGYQPGNRPGQPGTRPGWDTGGRVNTGRDNISGNRNWNSNRDVDINVNHDYGWGWNNPWAAGLAFGTAAAVTSAAIGSTVYSLPPSCGTVYYGGVAYYSCGGSYYQPVYSGSTVVYQVVAPPG